ncbi:unnamed protein product [Xylocopa violacea]|uniref:SHSP domain-containing protein n=1 Tax=Xylocopa violacea TaxID=135666 RepID=A0ABP1NEK9_XYLVO
MDIKSCFRSDADGITDSGHCPKCSASLNFTKASNPLGQHIKQEPAKTLVKPMESSYVMQIVSSGVRPDNVYEAKMLLAPEVELSSIKITVKGNNLRVNVFKPLNDQFVKQLPNINEKSVFGDLVRRTMRHCENLLIPEDIDSAKVRAVVDNKNRMLVLTAPASKPKMRNIEKS